MDLFWDNLFHGNKYYICEEFIYIYKELIKKHRTVPGIWKVLNIIILCYNHRSLCIILQVTF